MTENYGYTYSIAEDEFILKSLNLLSYQQIAEVLNRTPNAIRRRSYRLLNGKAFFEKRKNKFSLSKRAKICELYTYQGRSLKSLGEQFGCTHNTIKRIVDKMQPYTGKNPYTLILKSKIEYEANGTLTEQSIEAEDYSAL